MSVSIRNERVKLTASALDRASTGCLVVGIFAPLAAFPQSTNSRAGLIVSVMVWLAAAVVLHIVARRVLGRLRQ
jgi:hypothetical protein